MHENHNDKIAQFYKDRNIEVHITLFHGQFYNGFIQEISSDFLILIDRKLGEVPVFFNQIKLITPVKKEVKENDK